ncbi:AAA family ATPase [Actinopolyspora xinjiangensis]|uniref:AAA family ATPase n=1 Tax=Actinopolyspora xinjiangensis TaxID=405564 RepID=UPI00147F117A|nr:AAA family ATPase [Actinopolyspora xinjiangensis]
MTYRVAITGSYGSGKTVLSTALSRLTDIPRTHGSPMREPIGGEGRSVHEWTPGQLVQLTVNRYTERVMSESGMTGGFISDGSVLHEWAYAKVKLVAGSYPGTAMPLRGRYRSDEVRALESVVDDLGLLMKRHAERSYDAFLHVPVEFDMTGDGQPINENFRLISDDILLPELESTGIPVYTVGGDIRERLEQCQKALGIDAVNEIEEVVRQVGER